MSRSWLGRSTGRHAAGPRGRAAGTGRAQSVPAGQAPPPVARPGSPPLLGAPTTADAPGTPFASPVTDEARAAVAGNAPAAFVPAGADPVVTVDALGRKCPLPIIMLANQIRDVPVGSVIAVRADDPAAYTDIPAWCELKSHDCVFRAGYAAGWSFGIRRRY